MVLQLELWSIADTQGTARTSGYLVTSDASLTGLKTYTHGNTVQTVCCRSISKYMYTYICQELAQMLREVILKCLTLHAGARNH